jgi:hypothetical protein
MQAPGLPRRLFAALSGLVVLGAGLSGLAGARTSVNPTLYANYRTDCTFTVTLDSGATAVTIPPGTYQVFVATPFPFADNPPPTCEFPGPRSAVIALTPGRWTFLSGLGQVRTFVVS